MSGRRNSKTLQGEPIVDVDVVQACRICRIEVGFIEALVLEGVIDVEHHDPAGWRFDALQMRRLGKAARLHRTLGVNPPGIALALELMQMLDESRGRR